MKTADLYMRVSTDEQAERGFSIGNQEDILRHYCSINSIQVQKVIYEDFPAKNFNRPEWSSLFAVYKSNKTSRPDYILFTQWSRFSRSIAEAYIMIRKLQDLEINPQAVEQQLDLAVPENKITLAFYLVAPEVENDRRALNVKTNMRKAKMEGRWMGSAPIGYCNKTSSSGQKYIAVQEPQASLLKEAFEQIGQGYFSIRQVYRMAVSKGLVCSLNNFWRALKNPVYCGRIIIDRGNPDSAFVEGKHEKLISYTLFEKVQGILNYRKVKTVHTNKDFTDKMLPFRGFLVCPKCKQQLTGSGSKGNTKRYFYYHCNSACGFRVRADKVHHLFMEKIASLRPDPAYVALFKSILERNYKESTFLESVNQRHATKKIEQLQDYIASARSLLLSKEIDAHEYYKIKSDCEAKITILKEKVDIAAISLIGFKNKIESLHLTISVLKTFFEKCDVTRKRLFITLFLSKEMIWSESCFRDYINDSVRVVYNLLANNDVLPEEDNINNLEPLSMEYKRVLKIEHSKGIVLSLLQIHNVLCFLYDLVNLTIDLSKQQD